MWDINKFRPSHRFSSDAGQDQKLPIDPARGWTVLIGISGRFGSESVDGLRRIMQITFLQFKCIEVDRYGNGYRNIFGKKIKWLISPRFDSITLILKGFCKEERI